MKNGDDASTDAHLRTEVDSDDACNSLPSVPTSALIDGSFEPSCSFVTGRDALRPSAIRLVSYRVLQTMTEFPRFPNSAHTITTFENIDSKNSLVVFISHCWLRGGDDCPDWDGTMHPDNQKHDKFNLCLDALDRLWKSLAPSMENCYVWLDFACIDQDAPNPGLELEQLDRIMHVCDCMLTPIVDPKWNRWNLHLSGNLFLDYCAEAWRLGPTAYLNRAWCRMEMLYAASVPLVDESRRGGSRYLKFHGGLRTAADQNRRLHILYGSKEYHGTKQLLMLPPLRMSYFTEYNPEDGHVRYAADREKIRSLMTDLLPYRHHHYEELTRYTGELNEDGQYHGQGTLVHENGDTYTGTFLHGQRSGYGCLHYANGDQYQGEFLYNKRQGHGRMIYSNGNRYVGTFDRGYRHGRGVLSFADGSVYDGEFNYGYQSGFGRHYLTNGDCYEGEFLRDMWHGKGALRRGGLSSTNSSEEVLRGEFSRGQFQGPSSNHSNGEQMLASADNDRNHTTSTKYSTVKDVFSSLFRR